MDISTKRHVAGSGLFGSTMTASHLITGKLCPAVSDDRQLANSLRWVSVSCLLIFSLLAVPIVQAQEKERTEEPKKAAMQPGAEVRTDPETKANDGIPGILLTPKESEKFREFLKWRDSRNGPDYSITSVELDGRAETDERLSLTATITIQLNRDDGWLRIPLNLNEATLSGQKYQGDGTATPDDRFSRETGYHWWFRGKGKHVLTLSLIVPIKKQLPKRRLILTIPATAVSRLKLHVPIEHLKTEIIPEDAWVKKTPTGKAGSKLVGNDLEVHGFGRQLDLTWQPRSERGPVETVLQSGTLITVKLTGESVVLEATQQIRALQGSFSKVNVRLPAGFGLLDVEGKLYSDHEVLAGNHVSVTLSELTKGPVDLKWTLESSDPSSGGKLTIEGFEVDRARRQKGEIAISGLDGFRITRREGEDRYVHRINVSDPVEGKRATTAYGFLKQPFRLVLDLQEIEPGFTVKPNLRLRMSPQRAVLDAVFTFQVYRGAVPEILVHWPNARNQGWEIETIGPPVLLDRDQVDEQLETGLLRVPLLKRTKGEFEFHLKASRAVTADEEGFPLDLPYISASPRQPTVLDLFTTDNVEVKLSQAGTTSIRRSAADHPLPENLPKDFSELQRTSYRIKSLQHALLSKVTVREREISTHTTATVDVEEDRLQITQRITYNVKFERLSQILLLVPDSVVKIARFTLGEDVALTPNSTLLDEGDYQEVRLMLPDPQKGQFDIVARFSVELSEHLVPEMSVSVRVPLIQSSDAELSSSRLEFQHRAEIDVALDDVQVWSTETNLQNSSVWQAEGGPRSAQVSLRHLHQLSVQNFAVLRALILTAIDAQGVASSRAQYRIEGVASAIGLTLPRQRIAIDRVWWDRKLLSPADIVEIKTEDGASLSQIRLQVADTPQPGEHLLTVDFHSTDQEKSSPGWSWRHHLSAPEFAPGVWIEESAWQLVFPRNQLLFTQPDDYTPEFFWQRRGLIWNRQPLPTAVPLGDWIGAADGPTPAKRFDGSLGHSYRFNRFGPAGIMKFYTMSLSFAVLLGAGLSLAAGFVLLYLPLTRNVLTFLTVAFAVAAIAVWFPTPVELLLQPAVLGLLLAVVAALINSGLRRGKKTPVLTLSSPSDFVIRTSSVSSVEKPLASGAGSEEPTAIRTIAPRGREAISSPESESHV